MPERDRYWNLKSDATTPRDLLSQLAAGSRVLEVGCGTGLASSLPSRWRSDMTAAYECNGQPVSADAFYAIACDPRRSVAVEACAGAGKTWTQSHLLQSSGAEHGHWRTAHTIESATIQKAGRMPGNTVS